MVLLSKELATLTRERDILMHIIQGNASSGAQPSLNGTNTVHEVEERNVGVSPVMRMSRLQWLNSQTTVSYNGHSIDLGVS